MKNVHQEWKCLCQNKNKELSKYNKRNCFRHLFLFLFSLTSGKNEGT